MLKEVEGCPAKTAISAVSAISPKICEKLEKSQHLLKLLNSSGKGRRKVPNENCDLISEISPKIGKSLSW